MNPDIRPQDDLFGHVNGRWLDDGGDPRRPVQLGPVRAAGRHRRGAGPRDHRGPRGRPPTATIDRRGRPQDRRPLRVVHGHRADRPARHPPAAAAGRGGGRRCATCATWRRSSASSSGSAATACSGRTSTPTTASSDRYLFHITQGGLGLPDESYYRDDKFAEVRDKYVDYLEPAARARRPRRPGGGRGHGPGAGHPAGRRATGSARRPATSRRPTTC